MKQPRSSFAVALVVLAGWLVWAGASRAADHEDSPSVRQDPTTDLGDVLAWMSPDATKLNLVASLVRHATAESRFSDAALYVFHTRSAASFGGAAAPEVDVICSFQGTTTQTLSCWAGTASFVTGNASNPSGIVSADGKVRAFAGLRNDAFFFNSSGFNATRGLIIDALPTLGPTADAAGCPTVDSTTSAALVTQLMSNADGTPAVDAFANANILVLALQVDKSIVTSGGPIVSVWGSTDRIGSSTNCFGDYNGDGQVTIDELILAVNNALSRCEIPLLPPLGPQIDRVGRAAINTALIGPFRDKTGGGARGMIQDQYNQAADPSRWDTLFSAEIASNLALYDSLDTVCGNQLLAGTAVAAGRYDTLAHVLADDQLYVNTASGTCQTYLAVEANATGLSPNNDCGGRTPLYDTIDISYSVLAAGEFSGVTDGIPKDADGTASSSEFPFYDAPLPLL